jgi:hypothetical protein
MGSLFGGGADLENDLVFIGNDATGVERRGQGDGKEGSYCAASTMIPMFFAPFSRAMSRNLIVVS